MIKAKFHYTSWFGAGSKPNSITLSGSNQLRTSSKPAPNQLRTNSRNGIWLLPETAFYTVSEKTAYSQRSQIGCLSYFHTRCGLIANLKCRSEMYCTWLAENRLQDARITGYIFAIKAYIDNRRKLLNSNPPHVHRIWRTSAH